MRRFLILGGFAGLLMVSGLAVWWQSGRTRSAPTGRPSRVAAGTIRGTLLTARGPATTPRPFPWHSFEVISHSGVVAAGGRTTKQGQFQVRLPPGAYMVSIPGIPIQNSARHTTLGSEMLRVTAGHTISPRIVVPNPYRPLPF